jgi:hypothetical protein
VRTKWRQDMDEIEQRLAWLAEYRGGPSKPNGYASVVIERVSGFELFNTEPYHNYENWGSGWRITINDFDPPIVVMDETLGGAILRAERVKGERATP